MLAGLIVDEHGNRLTSTHAVKNGKRYRYYSSKAPAARGAHNRPVSDYRIPASEIEPVVVREIVGFLGDAPRLMTGLEIDDAQPNVIDAAITAGRSLGAELQQALPSHQRQLLEKLVSRVALSGDRLRLEMGRGELMLRLLAEDVGGDEEPVVIETTVDIVRHRVESRLVVEAPGGERRDGNVDDSLIRAVACGLAWFEELASGKAASFGEIAARVGVTDRYVSRIVDLAFLAPEVVDAVLSGKQRQDVTVTGLTVYSSIPAMWADQWHLTKTSNRS